MGKKKILLFSDLGVDDVVAALFAYYSQEVEIVGVVADYGNVSREEAVKNVKFIQQVTGISDIPVFGGAVTPLTGLPAKYYLEVHGPAGLGPIIPKNIPSGNNLENFFDVVNLIEKYKYDLSILSAGRLTSLATLFVLYPEKIKYIKDIYIMGGAFLSPGNVTPAAEANFYSDPYAANLVIQLSPMKLHIIPLDVTRYSIITPENINLLDKYFHEINDQAGKIIKPLVDYYYAFYEKNYPGIIGAPLHDLLSIWSLTPKAEIVFKEFPIKINVDSGPGFGQSLGDFRESATKAPWPKHLIAQSFNYKVFVEQVFNTFTSGPSR
ncbi:nucleoside hydrolase [Falsibacillus pallidus]|uniref:Purine nucleosidase n=1 Tax=Falsibacillus pallidus TaxID=493781 RepID=A0A370GHE7_9BACI|nr:nucleoside hydrolase [Falsibacillus pallidus]RDI43077.1 purine nucleosidase [Falsibacillus pallidus]